MPAVSSFSASSPYLVHPDFVTFYFAPFIFFTFISSFPFLSSHNPLYMRVLLALCLDHSMNLLSIHAASSILHWLLEFFPKHMHWYSKIFKTVIFIVILSAPKSLVASNCQSSKVQTGWRTPANGVRFAPIPSPLLCVSAHTPCKPLRCRSLWSNHSALWQMLYINPCI